jgi:hypothetical protein
MDKLARILGLGFRSPTCIGSCQVSYIGFCNPNACLTLLALWSHIGSNNSIILTIDHIGCMRCIPILRHVRNNMRCTSPRSTMSKSSIMTHRLNMMIITSIMMNILSILNMSTNESMVLLFMKRMGAISHRRLPLLLDEVGGLLAVGVLDSLMETKSILNGGMSTNGKGIHSKFNFFYHLFANFKLNI